MCPISWQWQALEEVTGYRAAMITSCSITGLFYLKYLTGTNDRKKMNPIFKFLVCFLSVSYKCDKFLLFVCLLLYGSYYTVGHTRRGYLCLDCFILLFCLFLLKPLILRAWKAQWNTLWDTWLHDLSGHKKRHDKFKVNSKKRLFSTATNTETSLLSVFAQAGNDKKRMNHGPKFSLTDWECCS